jgi:uncharacterized cofD-like protein
VAEARGGSGPQVETTVRAAWRVERRPRRQPKPDPRRVRDFVPSGPAVVAMGGGHGLAAALAAVRRYAGMVTAIVSVADDGGSSGRLRRDLDVPAPGDLRKCLVALAGDDTPWKAAFEHRFAAGELEGHALGNLLIVGLAETLGDLPHALEEAGRLLKIVGRVLPATTEPVVLKADIDGVAVEGQVAVASTPGRVRAVELVPDDAPACAAAISAIEMADQIVLAPGSLFTSLVPVLCVAELRAALAACPARVVQVCNLRGQVPETAGLDATDHLRAVLDHGGRVDTFLYDPTAPLTADDVMVKALGVEPLAADVARENGRAHDPIKLARALSSLV